MGIARPTGSIVLVLLLATAAQAAAAEARWTLRLDPETGSVHRFALIQRQKSKIRMGTLGDQTTEGRTRLEITQRVGDREDDGSLWLELSFDRIQMEMGMAGRAMVFDSGRPAEEDAASPLAPLRGLVGKTMRVRMSPRGEVVEVPGAEELLTSIAGGPPGEGAAEPVVELLERSFGGDAVRSLIQQLGAVLPEQPVGPGDTWGVDLELASPVVGPVALRYDYRVVAAEERRGRPCLGLAFDSTLEVGEESPLASQLGELFRRQGAEVDLEWTIGDASGSGTAWLDRRTGLPVELESTQQMTLDVDLAVRSAQGETKVPIRFDLTLELTMEPLD